MEFNPNFSPWPYWPCETFITKGRTFGRNSASYIPPNNHPYRPLISINETETGKDCIISFTNPISTSFIYNELFLCLASLTENDTVQMHLSGPGGSVSTGNMILTAMDNCPAKITTVANGQCASYYAILWANGDIIKVNPFASILFHSALCDMGYGRAVTMKHQLNAIIKESNSINRVAVERGLLTEDEFRQMVDKGDDIVLRPEEALRRANAFNATQKED